MVQPCLPAHDKNGHGLLTTTNSFRNPLKALPVGGGVHVEETLIRQIPLDGRQDVNPQVRRFQHRVDPAGAGFQESSDRVGSSAGIVGAQGMEPSPPVPGHHHVEIAADLGQDPVDPGGDQGRIAGNEVIVPEREAVNAVNTAARGPAPETRSTNTGKPKLRNRSRESATIVTGRPTDSRQRREASIKGDPRYRRNALSRPSRPLFPPARMNPSPFRGISGSFGSVETLILESPGISGNHQVRVPFSAQHRTITTGC